MAAAPALDRLELRSERLKLNFRFTYAFHAREVRFECDRGDGYERIFPETFSFRAGHHDPAEIFLQFVDLSRKPHLISPRANRRDVDLLISRLLLGAPRYLDAVLTRLVAEGRIGDRRLTQVYEDVALLAQILLRFIADRRGEERPGIQMASFHLRKLAFRSLFALVGRRVTPAYLKGYVDGTENPVDPSDDLSEAGFFYTMASGDVASVNRCLVRLAERAFYRWLEDVCLDEENRAFEVEETPFADRETEVRRAISCDGRIDVRRGVDLSPFLRRPLNRDCLRVLSKLEAWFLHQYDIHHAAVALKQSDLLSRGAPDGARVLSRQRTRNYVLTLMALAFPFVAASFAYQRAPRFFDALCTAELLLIDGVVVWFFLYRFCLKRDLTVFHASVPRIAAGIIVGYLPILFIDEVWGLAGRSWITLSCVSFLMGFMTLLYIYIEVQRRLGNP